MDHKVVQAAVGLHAFVRRRHVIELGADRSIIIADSSETVAGVISRALGRTDAPVAVLVSLSLDARITSASVVPRPLATCCGIDAIGVFREEMRADSAAVILVHSHPSGDPRPKEADVELTRDLLLAADATGIALLDHIILGRAIYYSFAESGELGLFRRELRK